VALGVAQAERPREREHLGRVLGPTGAGLGPGELGRVQADRARGGGGGGRAALAMRAQLVAVAPFAAGRRVRIDRSSTVAHAGHPFTVCDTALPQAPPAPWS